jgi:hypothetical protein
MCVDQRKVAEEVGLVDEVDSLVRQRMGNLSARSKKSANTGLWVFSRYDSRPKFRCLSAILNGLHRDMDPESGLVVRTEIGLLHAVQGFGFR